MELEFRRADTAKEIRRLRDFDRRVFPPGDLFPSSYWRECEVWWLLVDGRRVGCCAFQFEEEVLAIASTGLLPKWQGLGLGRVMKAWQIAYARRHGYRRLVTECRESNERMIRLNKSVGFRVAKRLPGYYDDPPEAGVVMELRLA
jgi:ribosomal protein S18 acetylase RimI-like enzyme